MADTKYGHLIKSLSFKDYGWGSVRNGTEISGELLGYDLNIRYGTYLCAGKTSQGARKHDYDQVMIFMGTNTYDIGYLGAEAELYLGKEKEKYVITTATAVSIPKGTPYLPPEIIRMDERFILMTVSLAGEVKDQPAVLDNAPAKAATFTSTGTKPTSKYDGNVRHLAFTRNGPWHYGPDNADTHGGSLTDIRVEDFNFQMSYENMNKAPYRFGPVPDKPHVHPYPELLLFMGADCRDLSILGAEAELYLGKEMEKHDITKPSIVILPKGQPHCPLLIKRQDRPWIFTVLRPWGFVGEGPSGYLP